MLTLQTPPPLRCCTECRRTPSGARPRVAGVPAGIGPGVAALHDEGQLRGAGAAWRATAAARGGAHAHRSAVAAGRRRSGGRRALRVVSLVNIDLGPSTVVGLVLISAGAALYQVRAVRPQASRDYDIFFSSVALLVGGILCFQGWRLDPLLLFGQILTISAAITFAVEAINLRKQATIVPGRDRRGVSLPAPPWVEEGEEGDWEGERQEFINLSKFGEFDERRAQAPWGAGVERQWDASPPAPPADHWDTGDGSGNTYEGWAGEGRRGPTAASGRPARTGVDDVPSFLNAFEKGRSSDGGAARTGVDGGTRSTKGASKVVDAELLGPAWEVDDWE